MMPTIAGTAGDDFLIGTAFDDIIDGLNGNDTISGGSGNDQLTGGAGNDNLDGGDGDDIIDGGAGNDIIDGGAGNNTVSFASSTYYVWINLDVTYAYDTRGGGLDTIRNIQNIIGSAYDDRLTGDNFANRIDGGSGDDFIVGGGGDDLLIGGDGNDQFLYTIGGGRDVIVDFSDGDSFGVTGYTSVQSITQVDNDVIVVFSATDQVTFLNSDIATISAVVPHPYVFIQPPSDVVPSLPSRPQSATVTGTVVLDGSPYVTIPADQIYYGVEIDPAFGPFSQYFRAGWGSPLILTNHEFQFDWRLINEGTVWNSSALNDVTGVRADSVYNSGTIVAEVGPFQSYDFSSPRPLIARAVVALGGAGGITALNNSGQIFAIADQGDAIAVYSSSYANNFFNSGLIAAQATYGVDRLHTGGAQGVVLQNGGFFINEADGQIIVEGERSAVAVRAGRGTHPASTQGPEIINEGLIRAVVGPEAAAQSVGIYAVNIDGELMRIVNRGTIEADVAIYCPSDPAGAFTSSDLLNAQTITNEAGGVIIGAIQLELGDDVLINAGTIVGTIDMGGYNDVVDNRLGTIDGAVLLGDGNDQFLGGAGADLVNGGDQDDVLIGNGGNDRLEGYFGDDILDGGAGNDGLYGGVGNDTFRIFGGDVARGGYGNDRFETGDYRFAKIDGGVGYDQWVLAAGARSFDLAKVASKGRVTNIEEICLNGSQTLVVHAADVAPITGQDTLHIRGDSTDAVYLFGTWSDEGVVVENGATFVRLTSGETTILIESTVVVSSGNSPPAAGGLDAIASGPAAPLPTIDPDSNIHLTSRFSVVADFTIGADEVWKSADGTSVLVFNYHPIGGQVADPPVVANHGEIINDVGTGILAIAVGGVTGNFMFESFDNDGVIRVETWAESTNPIAFFAGGTGLIYNEGQIISITHGAGNATGIISFDNNVDGSVISNGLAGEVHVFSQSGFATGVYLDQGGSLINVGLIEVSGGAGAIGIDQYNAGGMVTNSGQILVSSSEGLSIGIVQDSLDHHGVFNSGLISADIAILFQTRYADRFEINNSGTIEGAIVWQIVESASGRLNLTNSGSIFGNIIADPVSTGIETIVNSGAIAGDILLEGGNDSYDGRLGFLNGSIYAGTGADVLTGGKYSDLFFGEAGDDILSGNAGNDWLDGGAGNDWLDGGAGLDFASYVDATGGVNVSLALSGAQDTVGAGTDTLTSIENLEGSLFADILTGNAAVNMLLGQAGNDILAGGAGVDLLDGGEGDDIYLFVAASEHMAAEIDDLGTTGMDEVRFAATTASTLTLYANDRGIERVAIGTGTGASAAAGGTTALNVNAAAVGNALIMIGNNGANILTGTAFGDTLTGLGGDDYLFGGNGNDLLNGGAGLDKMYGGLGDDTYIVTDITDYAYEYAGEGHDLVLSSVSLTLRANVEDLTLTGSGSIWGKGNELDNVLTGNSGSNKLYGFDGNDTLTGGSGNDKLTGGNGADQLYGGTGDDFYYITDALDTVHENSGEGTDRLYSSIDYVLDANVEWLYLTGSASIDGTGNAGGNFIYGNDGDNVLLGMGGSDRLYGYGGNDQLDGGLGSLDRMYGGAGDDIYYAHDATDYAYENVGEGHDTVYADVSYTLRVNVEDLVLTGSANNYARGNASDNGLTGNAGDNKLYGYGGNDTVDGGAGNDWLEGGSGQDLFTGGTGADVFVFRDGDFAGMSEGTADRILDFSQAEGDKLRLNIVDANTTLGGDQAFAFIGTTAFHGIAGELRYEQLGGNTYVMGDTNGDGNADFWIRLDGLHTLGNSDFVF